MIATDLFSKYIELIPLRNQLSSSICRGLLDGWIFKHGPPRIMLSDQGPNVDGAEVRELLHDYGIEKRQLRPPSRSRWPSREGDTDGQASNAMYA